MGQQCRVWEKSLCQWCQAFKYQASIADESITLVGHAPAETEPLSTRAVPTPSIRMPLKVGGVHGKSNLWWVSGVWTSQAASDLSRLVEGKEGENAEDAQQQQQLAAAHSRPGPISTAAPSHSRYPAGLAGGDGGDGGTTLSEGQCIPSRHGAHCSLDVDRLRDLGGPVAILTRLDSYSPPSSRLPS